MKYMLVFILMASSCHFTLGQIKFEHITIEDGLSQNSITAIIQDNQGFLWFGTEHGLNKYNGYYFEIFYANDVSVGLAGNQVWSIYEDNKQKLWVGTEGGLSLFDRNHNRFYPLDSVLSYQEKPIESVVSAIYEDDNANLWLGTWRDGIYKMDSARTALQHYEILDTEPTASFSIRSIFVDQETLYASTWSKGILKMNTDTGNYEYLLPSNSGVKSNYVNYLYPADIPDYLWVTTRQGMQRFNYKDQQFESTGSKVLDSLAFGGKMRQINNQLWVASYGAGLYIFDLTDKSIQHYAHQEDDALSLANNLLIDIVADHSGCVWVGSWAGGLNKFCRDAQKFSCCQHKYDLETVFSIKQFDKNLFIATYGNGLYKINQHQELSAVKSPNDYILDILVDSNNKLWVAYDGAGIGLYDALENEVRLDNHVNELIGQVQVHRLMEDRKGNLWVGTNGKGVFCMKDSIIMHLTSKTSPALNNDFVYSFLEIPDGRIFLGTYGGGVNIYDQGSSTIEAHVHSARDSASLPSNNIWDIFKDSKDRVWLATSNGLSRYLGDSMFKNFDKADGLVDNWVYCILEDDEGMLWLSTNSGLSVFDPAKETFRNFKSHDGLQSNEFDANAKFKDNDGNIYFGGINGFNKFNTKVIRDNKHPPKIVFTRFDINGKSVSDYTNKVDKHISVNPDITLNHRDKTFSLEFSGLHFVRPTGNIYKYRLEGFDGGWVNAGTRNFVTYTNLDAGDYTFKVMSANSDGVWSPNTAVLKISVLPPPWLTWWAQTLYSLLLLGFAIIAIRIFIIRERLKGRIVIEHLEVEKMQEIDQMKSRFFTNISHEFRTPLTLILTPINRLVEKSTDVESKSTLGLIKRNASRLLGLINELLDLSKLEVGHLKLKVAEEDISEFLKIITASFKSLAESKEIAFVIDIPKEEQIIYFDPEKLEKITTNLLSNAMKFTPDHGEVHFSTKVTNGKMIMVVENNGVTISKESQSKIFKRFFTTGEQSFEYEGAGVGLALVKELAELHKGHITLLSENGITRFAVELPVDKKAYSDKQLVASRKTLSVEASSETQAAETIVSGYDMELDEKPLILIIEDNADLRSYIGQSLKGLYTVEKAKNGEEGLEKAIKYIPDLIVSDFMMPVIDGLEMMQQLREDQRTNHIPVIMLTAKADLDSRLSGIEAGADHYLNKPFEMEELLVRMKSLLEQRARVRAHYRLEFMTSPAPINKIESADEIFMKKLTAVVDKHLGESEYSVDQLAKDVAMSRVQLYRKLKAMIGCSASEFIRQYRLRLAYQYLVARKGTVSEIAFEVGFNNLSYFSKCFRETFKMNPSEASQATK